MGIVGKRQSGGTRGKAGHAAQLSQQQQQLLAWLLDQRRSMEAGDRGQRLEAANRGIPWQASGAAKALEVLPASASRTLAKLEQRGLVCCWATGEGKGRKVSHVKLPAEAVAVAEHFQQYGMSAAARDRQLKTDWEARWEADQHP